MGSIEHMDLLVHNQTMHPNVFRQTLWNGTAYKERDDVYYLYTDNNQNGKLTIRPGYAGRNSFGPELMVGWTLGDALPDRRVLLIKTAWGGRSLAVDFRPPASGEGEYSGVKPSHYGWEYRQMISDTLAALDHLKDYVPDYDADDEGYEFSGFVWFQGWNDMLNMPWVQEYGFNLANLIRDVRKDLDAPHMPVGR
jgi:alpha-galactosidase